MKVIYYDEIDSTNLEALRIIDKKIASPPFVVVADKQTAGKGQGSNSWCSQKGKNLTCTYVLTPEVNAEYQYLITVATSLSLFFILKKYIPESRIKIKWPNDIYVDDKKISGILVSNKIMGNNITLSVIGIGFNVNQIKFDSSLPNPVSLRQLISCETDLSLLLADLSAELIKNIHLVQNKPKELIALYKKNLYKIGTSALYTINGEKKECIIKDIDAFGNIIFDDTF